MSLGDDGATAASPPTEKGAWYESGLLPSTEVEGNLLECPADGQVKPIVGSALAAQREVCDEASLPFAAESQTRLAEVEHDAIEKHLVLAYKALVHDDDASHRRNIVAYLAARCEVSHVANVVVNSSFVTLLLNRAAARRRRVSQKAAPRPARVVGAARDVRRAGRRGRRGARADAMARVATDADADPATRCLALRPWASCSSTWRRRTTTTRTVGAERRVARRSRARALRRRPYQSTTPSSRPACRTLENVLAQGVGEARGAFFTTAEAVAAALAAAPLRMSRRRSRGRPSAPSRSCAGAAALGLAAPAAVRQAARASAARPPSRRPAPTRCGTPTTRAGSSLI